MSATSDSRDALLQSGVVCERNEDALMPTFTQQAGFVALFSGVQQQHSDVVVCRVELVETTAGRRRSCDRDTHNVLLFCK